MKDLKYLLAYTIPLVTWLAVEWQGLWSFGTLWYAFVFIPLLELVLPNKSENLSEAAKDYKKNLRFFDWLLYLNLPIVAFILVRFFQTLQSDLENYEVTGLVLSVGILLGASGINVAHELGHRDSKWEQLLAKILLLPELYMHFFIEHNRGHHKNIATDLDPASAKYNEPLQIFWLRSSIGSYWDAWKLENARLKSQHKSPFSWRNEMIWFQLIQLTYLAAIAWIWNWNTMLLAVAVAVVGFLLLETINYIEHYGLRRKKLPNGRYEKVEAHHSWNANYELGRIMLYELTRHSDHHYKSNKKYQLLDHHDTSPQLPVGYPASMLIALVPPIWFMLMNRKVPKQD